ncbi:DUF3862 domain-containing protein [Spectribacter hydrogenooxidans]|uniref:DUF3862 domain-containing protein n=1 Tax=Spectribacter hydrogenoxidans TaxID=3075608 RepID=A0ABU3C3V5_9GAMM|nr:DUF3862 domain-containing protein [Salinisphaera sp. W335]MDT0636230.1 DUF3862 domain-containing protein [Salinisphaera sp. W335]
MVSGNVWRSAGIGGLLLLLVACDNRVTRDNFDRIEEGMSQSAVIELLGEPDEQSSMGVGGFSGATLRWVDGDRSIAVMFANEEVAFRSFSRADP